MKSTVEESGIDLEKELDEAKEKAWQKTRTRTLRTSLNEKYVLDANILFNAIISGKDVYRQIAAKCVWIIS